MRGIRIGSAAIVAFALPACSSDLYVRDGVTDGDTFYLANAALASDDPVLQSWVSYSLMKSACQLKIGGDNPARETSFECEYTARKHLLDTWHENQALDPGLADPYLDDLARVQDAGYLDEYVVRYFARDAWQLPAELEMRRFNDWRRQNLRRHRPETRLIGSWNYASVVNSSQ